MEDDRIEQEESEEEMEFSDMTMEPPIRITIPPTRDEVVSSASCSEETFEDDDSSRGSATPSLSIPPSVGSSPMITTRSIGSRTSFDGFPSNSSSISMTSDRELVTQRCSALRLSPVEVQALDLSTNTRNPRRPLKSLKALSELTNLVQLDLSGNAVERLDGLQMFTLLQTLAMPRNHLKTLSAPLFALKGLTHLDLSGNFIVHLPRAFSGLTMLEVLNVSGNNLGTLREVDVLASLTNLLSCSLAANPFCRLPMYKDYVICKVRSLERLDEVEISRVARDRAAKRFGSAMFSQDACLREADRVHEDEQNRLLEAQCALEAENLRLKGELQVKSKLLQNKSRAWSSATEQLLQLQQEVAMLNLDRRRSVSLPNDEPSDAEQIAMAIAARHRPTNSSHQRPQSAPRIPSPERSVEKRRGSFSDRDRQPDQSQDTQDVGEFAIESKDAACMPMSPFTPMSPSANDVLKRSKSKIFVDASCSPLRVIPPAIITNLTKDLDEEQVDANESGSKEEDGEVASKENDDILSSPQTWEQEEMTITQTTTPPAITTRQQRERTQSLDQVRRALSELDPHADNTPGAARRTSSSFDFGLKEDELSGLNDLNASRSARFPTFEDDVACPAYEDLHHPAMIGRSSSTTALGNRGKSSSYSIPASTFASGSHSLPSSPKTSSSRLREWYRKQNELRLLTPPPSPPRKSYSPPRKPRRPSVGASPLAPFVDKDVLARQIQALQSCKQSLLTEIRNEEHLLYVLKQESAQYADQIDCLSVNIQACLDGDPSEIRFSFSSSNSPRARSKKLRDEETGRARLELLRNKLRFAEDKEKEIETTMVCMTKRVLHADLNPVNGESSIHEKFSPVASSKVSKVPFDKEIFALTHKLQLVVVKKEELHMQMSQLMAQLRGESIANGLSLGGGADDESANGGVSHKQVQSLAKSRQMVDELRTRHREVADRILLKERRISSLLEELKEVEAELQHISSLNESSALSPLFQRERTSSLEFLQAMHAQSGGENVFRVSEKVDAAILNADVTRSSSDTPRSYTSDQVSSASEDSNYPSSQGSLLPMSLPFKELLNPDMLEEIKADIYEKLSQQLATSADKSGNERSADGSRTDLHQAIAAALETRLHREVKPTENSDDRDNLQQEASQQRFPENNVLANAEIPADIPTTDEVCCDQFDEFAPVEAYYGRKFVFAKDRVSAFVKNISGDDGNANGMVPTYVTSAQRILKICERLEAAEAKSKFDPVSKIEVDHQGTSRGSLKVMLLAARDLPTAHLRTKNLDPYVCLEVVYPSHAVPLSANYEPTTGRILRSRTKKKSIYPVWDEDFEFTPILSLNGFLHVRVLNDRRLSREQLVGEARIPLQTLLHQKRIVEWFSLGLNVSPVSTGSGSPGRVVSKLCGGAIRLQLQLYFSSVERYKHVVDELVTRYLHDYNQLPAFIDSIDECEKRADHAPSTEQPEQNGTEAAFTSAQNDELMAYDQRRESDVGTHFPLDELATSLPPYDVKTDKQDTSRRSSNTIHQGSSTQLSSERRKSLWETKTTDATNRLSVSSIGEKKPYFGFATNATDRRKQSSASELKAAQCRSRTPTAQSKRIRNTAVIHTLRRRSVENPECFDEYSPYHPSFKSSELLEGCNNELGGVKSGRLVSRSSDMTRSADLSIFKRPSLTRRPPSSGFPERYIGLDNQTCERLKRIFCRMDGS